MGEAPCRQVRRCGLLCDLVEWLLQSDACTIVLIVCSTKREFLQKLRTSTQPQLQRHARQSAPSEGEPASSPTLPPTSRCLSLHTIENIARSQRATVAFCPSVDHLRAYLSVLHLPADRADTPRKSRSYPEKPMIVLVDPLKAHAHNSELSAQGVSRSLALAVEVAARERADLYLCECMCVGEGHHCLWDIDIPLLSSTGPVGGTYKPVQARRIARRWFKFDMEEMGVQNSHQEEHTTKSLCQYSQKEKTPRVS
ncbi:hypothetical protein VTO42DRAFT_1234 [Malbranchea cinnamomea]